MKVRSLVWLRNDLRLADNPALSAAVAGSDHVTALYVHEEEPALRQPGGAVGWWLGNSLGSMQRSLEAAGISLLVEAGSGKDIVPATAMRLGAGAVFWNRRYGPAEREIDATIKCALRGNGAAVTSFPGNVLIEPWDLETSSGGAYAVYTPFAKAVRQRPIAFPLPEPMLRKAAARNETVIARPDQPHWARKLETHWTVGEAAAREALLRFLEERVAAYVCDRDRPDCQGTSALSPHLRFGEISARQIWHAAAAVAAADPSRGPGIEKFLSELIWRDFNYHQLYHRADIATRPMRETQGEPEWRDDPASLLAWRKGTTGFPMIDAGMRQLWQTGSMHNRVRMLAASLLTKNLLIDWRIGERWFWDTLVDADAASNPANWQWVAGCGMDAAPYFRIFNPVIQGERFDAGGGFVRRWVPELAALPNAWIHKPFEAPDSVLKAAGIVLGQTYPRPLVDLKASRIRALEAVRFLR